MSRFAVKALDYSPEEGQLAQALLDQNAYLVDDETVEVRLPQSGRLGTFLPPEDIDPSTVVEERDSGVRYVSGIITRHNAVLTRLRPGHPSAVIGTHIAVIGTQIYEQQYIPVARWRGPLSRIIREVGRLANGWAGPGSRAPSEEIVRATQTLAGLLPESTTEPSVEVDPEDGTVALTWTSADNQESFTITIFNSGRIGGAHAAIGKQAMRAWIVSVEEYRRLSAHLNQLRLSAILCG